MVVDRPVVEALLRERLAGLGAGRSLDPTEIARALAGSDEKQWRLMMVPIRASAVKLARSGEAAILRKGRIVDPDDFKGVYRIAKAAAAQAEET